MGLHSEFLSEISAELLSDKLTLYEILHYKKVSAGYPLRRTSPAKKYPPDPYIK